MLSSGDRAMKVSTVFPNPIAAIYATKPTDRKSACEQFGAQSGFLPLNHSERLKLRRLFPESEKTFASRALTEPMTSCVASANLAMSRPDK
jgi:hypothetical protein